jgi:uncharacterized membrane protein YjgN (DUF898 family)
MTDLATLPPAPTPATVTAAGARVHVTAQTGALFKLVYLNLLLTVVTLGIYRFWAKTKLRRYMWRHLVVGDASFEYTGTGKELLIGFLKAVVVLLPPLVITGILELVLDPPWAGIVNVLRVIAILIVFAAGFYAARRYRMSRTTWSGIRFHQTGSPWRYAWLNIRGSILSLITLGLYVPWFRTQITEYETANLHLGSEPFRFTGVARDLFKRWIGVWVFQLVNLLALAWFGAMVYRWLQEQPAKDEYIWAVAPITVLVFAIPLTMLWFLRYRAAEMRYFADHTRLGDLRFSMTVRGRNLLGFYLMNGLILAVTLGIAFPILIRRRVTFWTRWLTLDGTLDLAAIHQTERGPRTGEGLANFFDMDFLGV